MSENVLENTKYDGLSVYQSNPLVQASKNMTIQELRVFTLGLLELHPFLGDNGFSDEVGEHFPERYIDTADVIKVFGGHKQYYAELRKITEKLATRKIHVKTGISPQGLDEYDDIPMFELLRFKPSKGGLMVQFNIRMKPFIYDLADKAYTKIAAATLFALGSVYSFRLLELMLQYKNIPEFKKRGQIERYFSLDEIKMLLSVPDKVSYNRMTKLKEKVLDRAKDEINDNTKYHIEYENKKLGRNIIGFTFYMSLPLADDEESIESTNTLLEYKERSQKEKAGLDATFDNLDANITNVLAYYGVGKTVIKRLVSEFSEEQIRNNIEYSLKQKRVSNLPGYITTAIRKDYYGNRKKNEIESRQVSLFDDAPVYNRDKLVDSLVKLGFNKFTAGCLINTVYSEQRRFTFSERTWCSDLNFEPDQVYEAIRSNTIDSLSETVETPVATVVEPTESTVESNAITSDDSDMMLLEKLLRMAEKAPLTPYLQAKLDDLLKK